VTKKKGKHLVVQIEAVEIEGQYYINTEQLSDLDISLTEFEKTARPLKKNPVSKK